MTDDIKKLIAEAREEAAHFSAGRGYLIHRLADALEAEHQRADEAVSMRNRAYRQRDEEREAKEGNVRVLNAALAERDALRKQIEGHGGWDEWIAEHMRVDEENERLRAAIQPVLDAWNDEGISPLYHRVMKRKLREQWNMLWGALRDLSRAIDTKEKP